ncbi:hypothetical protein TNCV_2311061 [Trichonephila clavipes]|nr:hypothetical protein TNCV_2311061 [Trichonephila clavipes]
MKLENAMNGLKESGLYALNRMDIQQRILITDNGNNQKHSTRTDSFTTIVSQSPHTVSLNSPLRVLKKLIIYKLSSTPSEKTISAVENSKRKRKRVQRARLVRF